MSLPFRLFVLALLMGGLTACTDAGKALNDDAACPGDSCTDDTQARYDAIARIDAVTDVTSVSRSYGLDRGSSRTAEVLAAVGSQEAAREVALEVMRELEEWPSHADGSAVVTVRADPTSPTEQEYADSQPLPPDFYDPCEPSACVSALARLNQVLADVDGLVDLELMVRDDTLLIRGSAPEVPAAQVATEVLDRVESDLDVRVARSVEVVIGYDGPVGIVLRLDGDLVCEQPPGMVVACEPDNSVTLSGEPVA